MENEKKYYAFISYKREDEKMAVWLQNKLEHYKLPSNMNGRTDLPKEIRPIFRDQSDLAAGVLADEIQKALEASKYLIVICSPRAAQSQWVGKEVQSFIDLGRTGKIIPFIIGGTAHAQDPMDECFPSALLSLPPEQELIGINIDDMGRDAAAVKVVAQMFDLKFDALWQRYERELRKKRKRKYVAVVGAFLVIIGVVVLMFEQWWRMKENQARFVAEKANTLVDEGNFELAQRILLEVLPDTKNKLRPYTVEADIAFRNAVTYNTTIINDTAEIDHVIFSPDGNYIASASIMDNMIKIWDVKTKNVIRTLEGHKSDVTFTAYSPDGKQLVSSSSDNSVRVWDVDSGKEIKLLEGHTETVWSVEFSSDGKHIVSASEDNTIRIWDTETGKEIKRLGGHTAGVNFASYSPNNEYIVSASCDGMIRIWDAETGETVRVLEGGGTNVEYAKFSPDGKHIVSFSWDNSIRIWDALSYEIIRTIVANEDCWMTGFVEFSPDNKYVVSTGGGGKIIRMWDAETGEELRRFEGHKGDITSAAYSSDGKRIVSASEDNTIRIWDAEIEKEMRRLKGHVGRIQNVVYSPDGKHIVSASEDNTIRIWDTGTGKEIKRIEEKEPFLYVMYSSDGNLIASFSRDNTIRIWDAHSYEIIRSIKISVNEPIYYVEYSPDNKNIVSVGRDSIWILDAETGKVLANLEGQTESVSYSPDGKHIVFIDDYSSVRILDAKTGDERKSIKVSWGSSATYSPDSKRIVLVDNNSTRICDAESGEEMMALKGIADCESAVYSSDGKYIVTTDEASIRIWSAETGAEIRSLNQYSGYQHDAHFSPDGTHVLWRSYDEIRIWFSLPTLQELIDQTRERLKGRPLTHEERLRYLE